MADPLDDTILDDKILLWPLRWAGRKIGDQFRPSETETLLRDSAASYTATDNENAPAELRSDAFNDDRTDLALKARSNAYEEGDALNWLLESAGTSRDEVGAGAPPQGRGGVDLTNPKPGEETLNFRFGAPPKVSAIHDAVARKFSEGGDLSDAGPLPSTKTVALGLAELPRQMVGGIRDAVQSIREFADWTAKFMPGGETVQDLERNLGLDKPLPEVGPARTMAGSAVRAITQMVRPYV